MNSGFKCEDKNVYAASVNIIRSLKHERMLWRINKGKHLYISWFTKRNTSLYEYINIIYLYLLLYSVEINLKHV